MWQEWFRFTQTDRRAFIVIVAVLIAPLAILLFRSTHRQKPAPASPMDSTAMVCDTLEADSFFDPNEADSLTLRQFGLRPQTIKHILLYRAKGYVLSTPEALQKIYGITVGEYERALPYVKIGREYQLMRHQPRTEKPQPSATHTQTASPSAPKTPKTVAHSQTTPHTDTLAQPRRTPTAKYAHGVVINLNKADTTELKKIPGIGSVRAKRIVRYRKELGGYYAVEQLAEIQIPDSIFSWFDVADSLAPCIEINKWDFERLRQHPYIQYEQARAIEEYRYKKGHIKQIETLRSMPPFTEHDIERLAHYVIF